MYRLLTLLGDLYFKVLFRRQWGGEHPHFFDHRHDAWGLLRGTGDPLVLYRGFNAGALVEPGDAVLDIGCGDGFFTSRFFGPDVDGTDIEPSAIAHARKVNPGPNYFLLDAVSDPFPRESYDVVVWDGALAHFSPQGADAVLSKVVACGPRWFCGSEGLGDESPDHLQVFDEASLQSLLVAYFAHVEIVVQGPMAYWRCH